MPYGVSFFGYIQYPVQMRNEEKTTTQDVENPKIVIQMRINRFRSCFFVGLQPSTKNRDTER
jgi:hypothetical protein